MRKLSKLLALLLALCLTAALIPAALAVGEPAGYTLHTDIDAQICGHSLPSYNIQGYTAVVAEDLANYGFDVVWDGAARTLRITRSQKPVSWPSYRKPVNQYKTGQRADPIYNTDIRTYINGKETQAFNINGRTLVWIDDLAPYGKVTWDNAKRVINVELTGVTTAESASASAPEGTLTVSGTDYAIGMSEEELLKLAGEPAERLQSTHGYTWCVYNTDDYANFFMAGVIEGRVVSLCASGTGFRYRGARMGDRDVSFGSTNEFYISAMCDKNDGNLFHCIHVSQMNYETKTTITDDALYGEARVNFHLVNAFRCYHGLSALAWSDAARTAACLHSREMAEHHHFSHSSLNGRSCGDRMRAQGIPVGPWAENISMGYYSGVDMHNGWVNSKSHRDNILGEKYTHLGVGLAWEDGNLYGTENYYG